MKTLKETEIKFTMQDGKDYVNLRAALKETMRDNSEGMKLIVVAISLAYFLSDVSEEMESYGINKEKFVDLVMRKIRRINELKEKMIKEKNKQ